MYGSMVGKGWGQGMQVKKRPHRGALHDEWTNGQMDGWTNERVKLSAPSEVSGQMRVDA